MKVDSLSNFAEVIMGQSPPGSTYNRHGTGVPLLNGPTEFGEVHPLEVQWTSSPTKLCKADDLLFCVRGATAGRMNTADKQYCLGRGVAAIRAKEGVFHNRFLHYVLKNGYAKFQLNGVGSTFINVSRKEIESFPVPDVPLPEQKRIAKILDAADGLRAKRRAALAQLDTLLQSTFVDLFGDPVTNPKGWEELGRLAEVAEIASGITKGRKTNGKKLRTVPYLAVVNVQDRELRLDPLKTIDVTEDEISRYRLRKDDLLLTEGGDPDKLGRGTLWNEEVAECIHQNHVFRVRLHDPRINPVYLNWLVGSNRGKRYFFRSAKQTTGIASINMTQLKGFPLVCPPLDLQRRFASIVESVERQKARHREHLAQLDTLFASLQQRAFKGEL